MTRLFSELFASHQRKYILCFVSVAIVLAIAASYECRAAGAAAPADTMSNEKLRAAAEPFEKLTEISFSATLPAIDRTIGEAESAAREIVGLLPADAVSRMDMQISAMKTARQTQDRAGLALSSIEVYRVLVSAVTDNAKVPIAVSLLDYAGFRYDADFKANPIRWGDMAQAVSFAHENWNKLLPRTNLFHMVKEFEKALADMDNAATQKNGSLAASSVKIELDLVDRLEEFFSAH
jgi:hypothetical protein